MQQNEIMLNWPRLAEIDSRLKEFKDKFSEKMELIEAGRSVENRSIPFVTLTDPAVADEHKQVAFLIAVEHGHERNGAMMMLDIIDWLLNDPEGNETLRKQIVMIIPVVNVDSYETDGQLVNKNGINLFADYHYDGSEPSQPESQAVWRILEKHTPDAFLSIHGMTQDYDASGFHRIWETTGIAFTNSYARCHNPRIILRMNAAAEAEGFSQDRGEEDLERILPLMPGNEYHSLPTFNHYAGSVDYAYSRFHTLSMVMEVGVVRSGFLRARELLRIGNERWDYECFDGYPNRIITAACISSVVLKSGGVTSEARRKNRVLLWQNSRNITSGMCNRHATHFVGFASRLKEDFESLLSIFNLGDALKVLGSDENEYGVILDWLREAGLDAIGCFAWNDAHAVSRFRERTQGTDFPQYDYDESLDTADIPMAAALRVRLDAEVDVVRVFLNNVELSLADVRQWSDSRFRYVELDIDENWQRAVIAVETTARKSCMLFEEGNR